MEQVVVDYHILDWGEVYDERCVNGAATVDQRRDARLSHPGGVGTRRHVGDRS